MDKFPHGPTSQKLVAPSILSADFANLEKELKAIEAASADWVHVDVMDGHFVNNITIGPPVVASLKKVTRLPLDVHLMIENPENYIEAFIRAGADFLTIHVETSPDTLSVLRKIRQLGARPGITLRPRTPLSEILPFLSEVDLILVMTVEPGFSGQSFMMNQIEKITALKKKRKENNLRFLIEVDGGVTDKTVQFCKDADVYVAGNFVFKNDYKESIRSLKAVSAE